MRQYLLAAIGLVMLVGCNSRNSEADGVTSDTGDRADLRGNSVEAETEERGAEMQEASILGQSIPLLDGTPQSLEAYRGDVVLIVNTASRCGLTPQYAGLQNLYESRRSDGFVVLGFPSNDFMGQEPGTDAQIAEFCEENYGVTFPMFTKVTVKGDGCHPLFRTLGEQSEAPSWNFTKYLLDRDGRLVRRFDPRTAPDDPELVESIDSLIGGV